MNGFLCLSGALRPGGRPPVKMHLPCFNCVDYMSRLPVF